MKTILIEIASYRDDELGETVASLLRQAKYPERLRFAIAQQYGPETAEQLAPYRDDARFRLHEIPWHEACGLGVARRRSDDMYAGEDFYFQIDAHMRAEPEWDARLEQEWTALGDDMAILSSYPPAYKYVSDTEVEYVPSDPNRLVVNAMYMGFVPTFFGQALRADTSRRGAFLAGGFQFGPGRVCTEVSYEPDVCFVGDEIIHSLRVFAAGYRVYSVIDQVLWHLYLRSEHQPNARHFWQDFQETTELAAVYEQMNRQSADVMQRYFAGKASVTLYDVQAYENFAGIDLARHLVHAQMYDLIDVPMACDDKWRAQAIQPRSQM